jgi:all-trans-8'-apo-beta-carotenal 15,15'-oxygenase
MMSSTLSFVALLLLGLNSPTQCLNTVSSSPASSKSIQTLDIPEIGPTLLNPRPTLVLPALQEAWETNTHPSETQGQLGQGVYLKQDWRRAWFSYGTGSGQNFVNPDTGSADYEIDEVEGTLPSDLQGTLYRNGPGKFGIHPHRVAHVLDGDGLIVKLTIPQASSPERKVRFQSRFVETKCFVQEMRAQRFLQRGTFGTGPMGDEFGRGVNEDPVEPSLWTKLTRRALRTEIKNVANTQIIAFGGKLLALFEAGLPYRIDPDTLETLGEDSLGGTLPIGKDPVKLQSLPMPDFLGGAAHTAHPKRCPRTGNLVGWHWSQIADANNALEVTVTEWSSTNFTKIASRTVVFPNCELAPHDMVLTEHFVFLKVNAISLDRLEFLSGLKGPAAALKMDGRAPVRGFIFPRPTCNDKTMREPQEVSIPPCFSIHFSHGYEDEKTGNLVTFFTGWPPSDSKDFLGAWGGFCPEFDRIPETFLWRLEIDMESGTTVNLSVAPGSENVVVEHCVTHPNFITKRAQNVYACASNLIGDSSACLGYSRHRIEDGSSKPLRQGERNEEIDCYFYGTRYSTTEPLVVPKVGADLNKEEQAYLMGIVYDAVKDKSFLSIFDLEKPLREGPVCNLYFKTQVPRGLHGCFDPGSNLETSFFC